VNARISRSDSECVRIHLQCRRQVLHWICGGHEKTMRSQQQDIQPVTVPKMINRMRYLEKIKEKENPVMIVCGKRKEGGGKEDGEGYTFQPLQSENRSGKTTKNAFLNKRMQGSGNIDWRTRTPVTSILHVKLDDDNQVSSLERAQLRPQIPILGLHRVELV